MKRKLSFLFLAVLFSTLTSLAQTAVKGTVVDQDTREPLIGVTIFDPVSKKALATTDLDGSFTFKTSLGKDLEVSYIGYVSQKVKAVADLGTIELKTSSIGLNDVVVTSSIAIRRKTPVALSIVDPEMIEAKLGSQEFPEILKSTPGVYATKQGGGYGDSRINLRGFSTENIAVMINGVPMNDMEWGGIYWSNFAGLSDVTRSMQVQRGLGAAMVSSPSVGGSINIVTRSTDAQKGGSLSYMMGNDGINKIGFSLSTGLSKDGWAMSVLGSKAWGDGYIQGSDYEAYTWFLNLSKIINDKHQLSFTAFGSPQTHNQRNRNDMMTASQWQQVKNASGIDKYKFNPTFGYDENGNEVNGGRNRYHKPQLSLNHYWTMDEKSSLSTAVYLSLGDGGGRRWRGTNSSNLYGVSNTNGEMNNKFTTWNKQSVDLRQQNTLYRDYSIVQQNNRDALNGSEDVISESINNHTWVGLLSTYNRDITDKVKLYGGVDLRYYAGDHREEIVDLFGGLYYIDAENRGKHQEYTGSQLEEYKYKKLTVGDDIYRNNTGYVFQSGVFGQAEYNVGSLSSFVSGALSNSRYWKVDRYYYDNAKSDAKNFLSGNIKGGANYNIDKLHNVFFNTGYISRAPYMRSYFTRMDQNNEINKNAVNEKSFSFELGYGFRSQLFSANLNLYYTKWMDKTKVVRFDSDAYLNMEGLDARHQGIEFDFVFRPLHNLELTGMFSLGDWIWDSKTTSKLYNAQGEQLNNAGKPINFSGMTPEKAQEESDKYIAILDLKDVRVGNSAQTTFALGARYKMFDNKLTIGTDYNFYGRNYADYAINDPKIDSNNPTKYYTPWRMPSAGLFDLNANYRFDIAGLKTTVYGNIYNVFNTEYISDAKDFNATTQGGGNKDNVGIFYGFGRTYTVSLKVQF